MHLGRMTFKDFLSYEDLTFDFTREARAIQGVNIDDDSQEGNGSGKSGLFYGLELLVLAQTSRGGLESSHVRRGCKKSYLSLEIVCPVRREMLFIERRIGGGKKLELHIVRDGDKSEVEFSSVPDGNKMILDWIGISKDDIQNYYIISVDRHKSFMTSSNTQKLEMISRLVNLTPLSSAKDVFREKIQEVDETIKDMQMQYSRLSGVIEATEEAIETEKSRDLKAEVELIKDGIKSKISDIHDSLDEKCDLMMECNKKIDEAKLSISKHRKNMELAVQSVRDAEREFKLSEESLFKATENYSNARSASKAIDSDIDEYESIKNEAKGLLREAELNLKGVVQCPKCGHNFNPMSPNVTVADEIAKVDECKQIINEMLESISGCNKRLADKLTEVNKLEGLVKAESIHVDDTYADLQRLKRAMSDGDFAIKKAENSIETQEERIVYLESEHIDLQSKLEKEEEELANVTTPKRDLKRIKELKSKISDCEDQQVSIGNGIEELYENKDSLIKWEHHIKRFSSHLAKKSLSIMSIEQNRVLDQMKSDMRVRWEGFKLNRDGSLSDKIIPYVVRNGEEYIFGEYSRGERARVEYSSIIANQNLINSTNPYGGLELLFTDEMTEGMDSLGISLLVDALNCIDKQILITTHVVNQNVNSKTITVTKKSRKSTLAYE